MSAVNAAISLDLRQLFPFSLDEFQSNAIEALNTGHSVVVCAPTGSGKTLVGEYAIYRALTHEQRVFYTTPLKALSNQKYRDFSQQFGADYVGLLTGDISINREAPILVMTTEIFRNMLYGTPIGEVGTSLESVQAVILDECHYMNDQQRGTVWEESIIYCPPNVQLIALSATIANSDQLTDWMNEVHGPTQLIDSTFRPVPLDFLFVTTKGMFPLLQRSESGQWVCNRRLKTKRAVVTKRQHRPAVPDLAMVVDHLYQRDMLPAIYFIFSRKGCDDAVQKLGVMDLIRNPQEKASLAEQIERFCQDSAEAIRQDQLDALHRGIAAHHAGHLPAWKNLVENLFQQGLVKVVFATETLAAGINMPARTTVISSLSKRTDNGHRPLNASEFMQMSGRAGRRGKDTLGYVVTVQSPFEGAREAAHLATSPADPLVSQFTPSYGMVLNLLQKQSLQQARDLINRSFGQYLLSLQQIPQHHELGELQAELQTLNQILGQISPRDIEQYHKLEGQRREERRSLRYLQKQLKQEQDPSLVLLAQQHIQTQLDRIAKLEDQIRGNPVFAAGGKDLVKLQEKQQRLQRKLNRMVQAQERPSQQLRWHQFMALVSVLEEFDCLQDYEPTPAGEVVAALRGDNELWLGLALRSGYLQCLTPSQLAAVMAALVTETPRSGTVSRIHADDLVGDTLHQLKGLRRQLFRSQRQHQIFHMPVWMEISLAGLVQRWADGIEWEDLERSTNLDPGDLVRLIRRTLDLLSQIPHVPHIEGELKDRARQAQKLLDRFPVSEMV
jgi:superfamily II RNA helicase